MAITRAFQPRQRAGTLRTLDAVAAATRFCFCSRSSQQHCTYCLLDSSPWSLAVANVKQLKHRLPPTLIVAPFESLWTPYRLVFQSATKKSQLFGRELSPPKITRDSPGVKVASHYCRRLAGLRCRPDVCMNSYIALTSG